MCFHFRGFDTKGFMILGYVILLHAKLFVVFYRVIAIDGVFFVYIVGLFSSFYCHQYNYVCIYTVCKPNEIKTIKIHKAALKSLGRK